MNLKKYAPTFIVITTVASFITDVLQPLGNVLFYTLIVAFVGAVTLTIIRKIIDDKMRIARGFLWIWTSISGLFFVAQLLLGAGSTGVAADLVPGIASLQDRLGIMQKQIEDVRENTEEIKESTSRIESTLGSISSDIQEIGQLGGIIVNPDIPEEWYSNAKLYELKGDFGNARRSYMKCLIDMPNKIDAHLDFIQFLKAQEGRIGAREIYLSISRNNPGVATKVAMAMLLPPMQRIESLESIDVDGRVPPPVLYLLANQFSEDTLGVQTLSDKRSELKWLEEFVSAKAAQPYLRYFANQGTAEQWSNNSLARLAAIKATTSVEFLNMPIELSVDCSDIAILIDMHVAEPTLELKYRTSPNSDFTSTGLSPAIDPQTGKRKPNSLITVQHQDEVYLEVMYDNMTGKTLGPFDLSFATITELRKTHKNILQNNWSQWASYDYEETTTVDDDMYRHQLSRDEANYLPGTAPRRDLSSYMTTTVIRSYFLDLNYLWERGDALSKVFYRVEGRGTYGEIIDNPQEEKYGSNYGKKISFSRESILPELLPASNLRFSPIKLFINATQFGSGSGNFSVTMGGVDSKTSVVYIQLEFYDGEISEERAFPFQFGPDLLKKDVDLFENMMSGKISPSGEINLYVDPDKERYPAFATSWLSKRAKQVHWNNPQALNSLCMSMLYFASECEQFPCEFCDLDLNLELAIRANELTQGKDSLILDTLARAYWELGNFMGQKMAIKFEEAALKYASNNRVWDKLTDWHGPENQWCELMLEWYKNKPIGLTPTENAEFKAFVNLHE